ncbi:MAG: efflux RND transporter permease subunit [Parcubacteria group bacterium]|nr:efflux RND transporter permease subunit [Parcubacteria group bacterium]
MFTIWSFFIKKKSFSYLLMVTFLIFGLSSLLGIPKESNPEVEVPIAIVSTFLTGAAAEDIERLITNKIEDGLKNNLDELKNLTSTSRESVSSIVVEFDAKADIDKSIQSLKDEIDKVAPELPSEAEDPVVTKISFVDEPILTIAVSGDLPAAQFVRIGNEVEREIKNVRGVSKVGIGGMRDKEVQIIVNREALSTFGLTINQIIASIAATNSSLPVGNIEINNIEYNVEFRGDINDPGEIADIAILSSGGQPVYIRDVAFVSDGLEKTTTFSRVSIDGAPSKSSLSFDVFKRPGGDITKVTSDVRERLESLQAPGELLDSLEVLVVFDTGEFLREDLLNLTRSGLQTVALVMGILFLTIGWREALIAGVAIPLSFLVAFIALEATGNTLNFVSLFSLILVIGILVDSAIVVVEGIHTRMKSWMDKENAALATIKEFHWPITSGTMTTVAMFVPLFLVSGIVGEFISSIPFTVMFVLLASLLVALGLIPLIASIFMRRRTTSSLEEKQEMRTKLVQEWYKRKLRSILGDRKKENRFMILLVVGFIVAFALPILGLVKVEFFPQEDIDFIFAEVELPQGTTLNKTDLEARKLEEILYQEKDIDSFVMTVGQASPFGSFGGTVDEKFASVFINLKENRKKDSTKIVDSLKKEAIKIHSSEVRVSQPSSGPPVGAAVSIKFLGDDLEELDLVVADAAKLLESIPGTSNINTSAKNDSTEFVLTIDKTRATELGLDSNSISQTLRAAIHGTTATTLKNQEEDIDVVVRLNLNPDYIDPHNTNQTTIDTLRQLEIPTPNGSILLGTLLSANISKNSAAITHDDRLRVATVSSSLTSGGNAREVVNQFLDRKDELDIPTGITIDVGGENEDVEQSFKDMFRALIIGMVSMFAILVLQFNSFRHAGYVLVIVPLSLIGIFAGLLITQKAVSFPTIMGFIALTGIVVNNSIILIDTINNKRRENGGTSTIDVVVESAATRLRPILLTTTTTVIGVIPLIFASELWAPIAYSIMFGLAFSVIITLLLVPMIYNRWPGTLHNGKDTETKKEELALATPPTRDLVS